ncbi:Lrp/AsnC family transcriptional regulator [Leifsonia naganoensis]|uniref:DNA-binding Lrp family transcriptional regulator n=1 Tax=Leifsonia naganoensis TaxID=150025 RepID=A0A853DIE5_9MICO|nr:Lrp/AsnC family transcriptional regulator [Leifsonia naganoensis]NYK08856.1 DNA-binding Lrp family transcriptional regulator [Leifsonia naganoensis]
MDGHRTRLPAPGRAAPVGHGRVKALDTLDELDRKIIVALQHDGRASWTAIADMVGSSTATVARRGQQLVADGVVRIAIVPALGSSGQVDSFLVRLNCRPGTQLEVAAALVAHEDVRFLTLVTGQYDIMAEVVVTGGAAHYPKLIQSLQSIAGIKRWRSDIIMHVYKVRHDWSRQLYAETMKLPAESEKTSLVDPEYCEPAHFDDADRRILTELREDGRVTFQSIGDKTGMNESSVRRRFDRLRAKGCVDILTLVPAAALGMGAETLLLVRVAPARLEAVANALSEYPAVRYLAAILDDNSLFCELITPSVAELNDFISHTLSALEGVEGWTGAMELLYLKRGFVETPWWRTQVGVGALEG